MTIKPGAYPWQNHANAWRPAHVHFSLFGPAFATRLVTQMYFPGDPLLELDPIFRAVPERARERLVAAFDLAETRARLGARLPLRRGAARARRHAAGRAVTSRVTPAQTIGPFFHGALCRAGDERLVDPASAGALELAGRVSDGAGAPVTDALVELWATRREDERASAARRPTPPASSASRCGSPRAIPGPGESVQAPHLVRVALRARAAAPAGDAHLLPGRDRGERARPAARLDPEPARRALLVARAAGPRALRFEIACRARPRRPFLDV